MIKLTEKEKEVLQYETPTIRRYFNMLKDNKDYYAERYGIYKVFKGTDGDNDYSCVQGYQYSTRDKLHKLVEAGILVELPLLLSGRVQTTIRYPYPDIVAKAKRVKFEQKLAERKKQREKEITYAKALEQAENGISDEWKVHNVEVQELSDDGNWGRAYCMDSGADFGTKDEAIAELKAMHESLKREDKIRIFRIVECGEKPCKIVKVDKLVDKLKVD